MTALRLFSLDLQEIGGSVAAPESAGLTVRTWDASLQKATGMLKVAGHLEIGPHHAVIFDLELQMRVAATGAWEPVDGEHRQHNRAKLRVVAPAGRRDDPNDAALEIDSGALALRSASFPSNAVRAKSGLLSFHPPSTTVIESHDLPLSIDATDAGFSLDLSEPAVAFAPAAFLLTTSVSCAVIVRRHRVRKKFFPHQHRSGAQRMRLDQDLQEIGLSFDPLPKVNGAPPLVPLHVYQRDPGKSPTRDNPIIVPIGLSNHGFEARVRRVAEDELRLTTLRVRSRGVNNEKAGLHLFSYAERSNQPTILQLDNDVPLQLRRGSKRILPTLLIAPGLENVKVSRNGRASAPVHGVVPSIRFVPRQTGHLMSVSASAADAPVAESDPEILGEATLPWILFDAEPDTVQGLEVPKPGDAHLPSGAQAGVVSIMRFQHGEIALPLLPRESFESAHELAAHDALAAELDRRLAGNVYALAETMHESGLIERSADPGRTLNVSRLFPGPVPGPLELGTYEIVRDYGPVKIRLTVREGQVPDYVLLEAGGDDAEILPESRFDWTLGAEAENFRIGGEPKGRSPAHDGSARLPLAILKLSRSIRLREIFEREGLNRRVENLDLDMLDDVIESQVQERSWLGLVLFAVPLNYEKSALDGLLAKGTKLDLTYVAISPEKPFGSGKGQFNISARIAWKNVALPLDPPDDLNLPDEVWYRFDELDLRWYDNALVHLHASARLLFRGIFGLELAPLPPIRIEGTLDKETKKIEFRGRLAKPLDLLDQGPEYGPIQALRIASANIRKSGNKPVIDLAGVIEWRSFGFYGRDWFRAAGEAEMPFSGLTIDIVAKPSWAGLALGYPNLSLPADAAVFELGYLKLTLSEIAVDFASGLNEAAFLRLDKGAEYDANLPLTRIRCRLELMKLPELAGLPGERLTLEFVFALGYATGARRHWSVDTTKFLLRGFGMEGLRLSLMRFAELEVGRAALEIHDAPSAAGSVEQEGVSWLVLENISVTVLNQTVIEDLSSYVFSTPDGQSGFLGFLAPGINEDGGDAAAKAEDQAKFEKEDKERKDKSEKDKAPRKANSRKPKRKKKNKDPPKTLLRVDWALVAQNMRLDPAFAQQLVSIDANGAEIGEKLVEAFANDQVVPQEPGDPVGDWLFAGGLDVLEGFLIGKFLFQEGAYYGLALDGEIFEKYLGLELALSVLYIQGEQADEDAFIVSVRVPEVTAPAFTFMGGIVTLEVMMNGSFMLDVGFPHLDEEGRRDWDRAFGAIITPFAGKAGLFIRYRSQKRIAVPDGKKLLVISAGYASQIGLGGSYGSGTFEVSATIGLYFVLHGDLVIYDDELQGLRMVGALGVVVRASAELNWWIISVSLELTLGAEARATLLWVSGPLKDDLEKLPGSSLPAEQGTVPALLGMLADVPADGVKLSVDLTVWAEATAEACIGSGWFKICGSISVSIPMRISYSLVLS